MNWNELASKIEYTPLKADTDMKEAYPGFSVWEWGTGRYAGILGGMESDIPEGRIVVGDYEYEYSKNRRAPADVGGMNRGISFCILQHDKLDLPSFNLRNEAPVQKLFKRAMGRQDIAFIDDSEFSERFEVQGPEKEVLGLFRPEIRSYFLRHFEYSSLRLEVMGDSILLHFGMMINPEDSRLLIYSAVNIANFWMKERVKYEIPSEIYFK